MMKMSLAQIRPFALCMLNEEAINNEIAKIPAIATLCTITDFDQNDNGGLKLQIIGTQKVRLTQIHVEYDDLLSAEYTEYPNWPTSPVKEEDCELADKLQLFFETMPEIGALYPDPHYKNLSWICQRWIEVLPLEVHYKQLLITQDSPKLTCRFLHRLFFEE